MISNDARRARVKLSFLEQNNIGWLIDDIVDTLVSYELHEFTVEELIELLRRKYKLILSTLPEEGRQLSLIDAESKV